MTKEALTMSQTEVDRVQGIQRTVETRGHQAAAARQLGVSVRQAKRRVPVHPRRPRYKPAPDHPWRQPFRPPLAPPPSS